jgi:hypothetical protein
MNMLISIRRFVVGFRKHREERRQTALTFAIENIQGALRNMNQKEQFLAAESLPEHPTVRTEADLAAAGCEKIFFVKKNDKPRTRGYMIFMDTKTQKVYSQACVLA